MNRLKCCLAATVLAAAGAVAAPLTAFAAKEAETGAAQQPPASGDVAEWVSKKVEAIQPSAAERRFDQIGWLTDLREAIKLGKEHNRPVFLFTHDGRIALGRC